MIKSVTTKIINLLDYRYIPLLKKSVRRLKHFAYTNIGLDKNGRNAPKALFIFPTNSLGFYIQKKYFEGTQVKMHNIYFQGLAILDRLVKAGYVVDCVQTNILGFDTNTSHYSLIIDEGSSLPLLAKVEGQKKIYYCTGLKWSRWNANELLRLEWFKKEYGIYINPLRQASPVFSDEVADYILFKGTEEQMQDMNAQAARFQLAMPVDFEPAHVIRDYGKREFVWIGGWGVLHKGLDIAIDAFEKMPGVKLHIFGALEKEKVVYNWMIKKIAANPNISYHGYADYKSQSFFRYNKKLRGTCIPQCR